MGKKFLSTEALYGVPPKELGDMLYKDALQVMKAGLWNRKRILADELFASTDGDEASAIQEAHKKVLKAIDLTDLRIEELK